MKSDAMENGGEADEQLAGLLERILSQQSDQASESTEQLLANHPELAGDLESCLRSLAYLQTGRGASQLHLTNLAPADRSALHLGDYRIVREIGRGGMGIVFEAVQRSLDRRVALKVLPWATLLDTRQRERFHNEARLAAQLHHTNIVPVYSVGSEQGIDFYAMQFIDGAPLHVWARRQTARGRGWTKQIASLGIQAAEALAYAHQMGVVHRDIKPSNLLVDRTGNLWITDFGVARSRSALGATATGDRIGTAGYMSPEQFAGHSIDHRTDIYALGVTLIELLIHEAASGSLPADEETTSTQPRLASFIRRADCRLPRDLVTILCKSTAPVREDRYDTARDMADDLQHFLRDEPITAQRPGPLVIGAKWVMRHRRLATAGLLVSMLLTTSLAISTFLVTAQRLEAERQRAVAEQERARADEFAAAERRHATEARTQRRRAENLLARSQVQHAVRRLENGDPIGLLELVQARKMVGSESPFARDIESLWSRWHAIWEGRLLQVFGHDAAVAQVLVSPDGSRVATASTDATGTIWDALSGKRMVVLKHADPVAAMCFEETGKILATSDARGVIRFWSVEDGREVVASRQDPGGASRILAFRPGGPQLASAAENSSVVRLWPIRDASSPIELVHDGPVVQIEFVEDGSVLAAAARNALYLWDVNSGRLRFQPIRHKHSVTMLCGSADGRFVATGGPDGAVRVWNVATGREAGATLPHPKRLIAMRFSPDGRWLATASADRALRRWETSTWTEYGEPIPHSTHIAVLSFSGDSRLLASGSRDGAVRAWDVASGAPQALPLWHQAPVRSVAFDARSLQVVTASDDGTARVWTFDSVARGANLSHSERVTALAVSPDSSVLATGDWLGEITCWELTARKVVWRVRAHQERITSLAFSRDGALVASASEDGTSRLWNAADGQPRGDPLRFMEGVKDLAFTADGESLIVGCNDKTVTLWDVNEGKRQLICRDGEAVKAVAVDPAGEIFAYGTNGWQTHVRSVGANGALIASLPHGDRVRTLCFSPASPGFLAVGGEDGLVRLWNTTGFSPRSVPLEQGGEVYDLDVHPDGLLLVAAVRDQTFIRLWNVTSSQDYGGVPLGRGSRPLSARFTPNGEFLISGWADGACWLWPLPAILHSEAAMQEATEVTLGARLDADGRPVAIRSTEWRLLREATSSSRAASGPRF